MSLAAAPARLPASPRVAVGKRRLLAGQGAVVALTFAVGLLLLLLPVSDPEPIRVRGPELLAWTCLFLVGVLWVTVHVRRRRPELLARALRWYCLVWLVKLAYLVWTIHLNTVRHPEFGGHMGDDSVWFDVLGRTIATLKTGADYGIHETLPQISDRMAYRFSNFMSIMLGDFGALRFGVPLAFYIICFGYSVCALLLAIGVLAAFWFVQIWLLLDTVLSPRTANIVRWLMLLTPELMHDCAWLNKDIPTAVLVTYGLELALNPHQLGRRSRWVGLGTMVVLAATIRPQISAIILAFYALGRLSLALPRRAANASCLVFLGLLLVMLPVVREFGIANPSPPVYLILATLGLWLVPGTYYLLLPVETLTGANIPHLYSGLAWPWVAGLLIVGVVLQRQRKMTFPALFLVAIACFSMMSAAVAGMLLLPFKRLPVWPLVIAYAVEAWLALGRQPRRARRRLSLVVVGTALSLAAGGLVLGARLGALKPLWPLVNEYPLVRQERLDRFKRWK